VEIIKTPATTANGYVVIFYDIINGTYILLPSGNGVENNVKAIHMFNSGYRSKEGNQV